MAKRTTRTKTHCCSTKCGIKLRSTKQSWKDNISKSTILAMKRPEVREAYIIGLEKRNQNPQWRNNCSTSGIEKFKNNPELAFEHSKRMVEKYKDVQFYENFVMSQNTIELRQFRSDRAIEYWANPSNRIQMSRKIVASWESGRTGHGSTDHLIRMSLSQRALWTPEKRASHSGPNNPMSGTINLWWNPWMTDKADEIFWSRTIKKFCGNKCTICSSSIDVHAQHIVPKSFNPGLRYDLNNGVALCQFCHSGASNSQNVHRILRTDPGLYKNMMSALLSARMDKLV